MAVYVEKIVSLNMVRCRRLDLLGLRVQSHGISYDSEDGDVVDPIANVCTPGYRDARPCAIFSQPESLVRQGFYFAGDDSLFDSDFGSDVAFEPEPLNQVSA